MRIIAGKLKGKHIETNLNASYRPTTAVAKEAIFNILYNSTTAGINVLENAMVLDLYSGSGALAFEALSRGAKCATMVEINNENIQLLRRNIKSLALERTTNILTTDATKLPKADKKYNLIFLDPPFHKNLVTPALESLIQNNWIAEGAIVIIETAKNEEYVINQQFTKLLERKYGKLRITILKYQPGN